MLMALVWRGVTTMLLLLLRVAPTTITLLSLTILALISLLIGRILVPLLTLEPLLVLIPLGVLVSLLVGWVALLRGISLLVLKVLLRIRLGGLLLVRLRLLLSIWRLIHLLAWCRCNWLLGSRLLLLVCLLDLALLNLLLGVLMRTD